MKQEKTKKYVFSRQRRARNEADPQRCTPEKSYSLAKGDQQLGCKLS